MASITKLSGLAPLATAALLLGAGCNNDPGSGTLTINYQFGAIGSTCQAEGVTNVRVTVGNDVEEEPCNDDGEITLSGVPAGNYDLVVEGIDVEGITVRDNIGNDEDDERVEVIGGSSTDKNVLLFPTPAEIELTLVLLDEDGLQLPSLDTSMIESFSVRATEGTNNLLLDSEVVIADLTSARTIVPDPDRTLNGEEVNTVVINAIVNGAANPIDADPNTTAVENFTFEAPGHGRLIEIRIECQGSDCTGMVQSTNGGTMVTGGASDTDSGTGG
jgi:hypothetical protein